MMPAALATSAPVQQSIHVFDDVLPDPRAYMAAARALPYGDVTLGDQTFRGIAVAPHDALAQAIRAAWRVDAQTTLSFFRQSPQGQEEPTYIHSDAEMGQWTAILYLNPDPPTGDGTTFWRDRVTDQIAGPFDAEAAAHRPRWERWQHVEAKFNRLLIFQSEYYHSRGLIENYGHGDDARLTQVAFGTLRSGIRRATETDVSAIVAMAARFIGATSYRGLIALDRGRVTDLAHRILASDDAVFFVAERDGVLIGMLAMHVFEHPMSGERVASEVVWWMEPEARGAGVRLFRAAEGWATARGAAVIQMVAPTEQVGAFYQRAGYMPIETAWQRRV